MLESLDLRSFKSWREAKIDFAPITGLFGTNSSGKSSLIQFLLMLKQTREERDRSTVLQLNGPYVELGQYSDIVNGGDIDKRLQWDIRFRPNEKVELIDATGSKTAVAAAGDVFGISSEVVAQRLPRTGTLSMRSSFLEYSLSGISFRLALKSESSSEYELVSAGGNFEFIRNRGRAWALPGPIRSYAFPDQARTYYQNAQLLSDLEATYEQEVDNLYYLGPLRVRPSRDYIWTGTRPIDVGNAGERTIEALVAATAADEERSLGPRMKKRPLQHVVAHWLKHLGLIDSFSIEEVAPGSNRWIAKVRTHSGSPFVPLTDVGTGVSQVLPVITLLQYVPEGATVIFEQPEIHLHPLAQAGLADVIIQAVIHRRLQVILESHSEHLLLRLQRRIAESRPPGTATSRELSSDKVKLFFAKADDGVSTLVPLDLDIFGNIRNWPDKFMGDAFSETSEAELARLRRMQAAK
ncbi:putative ATPase [Bradyrhizobium embrapense]